MERDIIIFLIDSYFDIKNFFFETKNISVRTEFLKSKAQAFHKKYYRKEYVLIDEKAQEHLEKNFSIFIKYKDTSFIFPHMFAKYIELEEMHKIDYLQEIELYFSFVRVNKDILLHIFLTSFFYYLQQIDVKLSNLEFEVLKLLTNNEFMFYFHDEEGNKRDFRTYAPTYLEIFNTLKKKEIISSKRTIQKLKTYLFNYQICYDRRIFINFAKIGFIYVFIEKMIEIPDNIKEFCLWEIQHGNIKDIILCIPFGNVDELVGEYHYEILSTFYFNVDISQYDRKKKWANFNLPFTNLISVEEETEPNKINNWDIKPLQKIECPIDSLDVELLDNITKSNTSNYVALSQLTKKITKNHIDKRLSKLAKCGFFRFHSQVNFLGIDLVLCLKIRTNGESQHRLNIINFFSFFPEVMMFTNKDLMVVYIRVPKSIANSLLKNIYLFNLLFKNQQRSIFLYSQDYYNIKNSLYVLEKIKYEQGIAKLGCETRID